MSIIPPDPGRTLGSLRSAVVDLKELARLNPNETAYAEALKAAESAVSFLEPVVAKTKA